MVYADLADTDEEEHSASSEGEQEEARGFGVRPRGAQERFWGAVAFDVGDVGFQCMGFQCMGFKCMGFKAPIKPADQIDQKVSSRLPPTRRVSGNRG